jgi:WD40 repeat protein
VSGAQGVSGPGRLHALGRLELPEYPVDAAWVPDGRSLLVGLADGSILRVHPEAVRASPSAPPPVMLQAHAHSVLALTWQKAGRLWASSGQDGRVLQWDARLQEPRLLHEERQWSGQLAFAERGNALAVATGRALRVFDEAGTLRYQHLGSAGAISALAWHPRAGELASAGNGGVLLHRIESKGATGGTEATAPAPRALPLRAACVCVAFHPEGRLLAAGLQEGSVQLWNLATGSESRLEGLGARVLATEWSANGRYLAAAAGSELVLWDFSARTGGRAEPAALRLPAHSERITAIGFRPGGNWLASAGRDRRLLWWRAGAGDAPQDAHLLADECSLLRFSRDGSHLAAGDAGGGLSIFECKP